MSLRRILCWLDENLEKVIIATSFAAMALIVVVAVVQRFAMNYQPPWSGSIPIYLFLWVTWIGAAYNVRTRTQLRFGELRARMSRNWQFVCLLIDTTLWISVAAIVIYYSIQQTHIAYQNFAVVQGTDNLQQWWFYLATPLGWSLVILRALQNLVEDIRTFRRGEPLIADSQLFT